MSVDLKTLENILRKSDFNFDTDTYSQKGFSYINSAADLGLTSDNDITPQNIFNRAPMRSIVSIDTPNNGYYPEAVSGHIWMITSDYTYAKKRATPILCVWNNGTTSDTYFAVYNNVGDTFIWHRLNRSKTSITDISPDGEPNTVFSYRVINDQMVEWWLSAETLHTTLSVIATLPANLKPSKDCVEPLVRWYANSYEESSNEINIRTNGEVQLINFATYIKGHGIFVIG